MQTLEKSLLEYLRTSNPDVRSEGTFKPGNTSAVVYQKPRALRVWEEFEYETMDNMFDGNLRRLLGRKDIFQDFSKIPDFPFRKYYDENSLESLLIKWNHSIVSEALAKTQADLDDEHERIYMVRGGQAELPSFNLKPDWGCVKRSPRTPPEKQKNLLPGDTKMSTKWSSSTILKADGDIDEMQSDEMLPLMQIYSYLIFNETRYGFIITDTELFVVRVRLEQGLLDASQKSFTGNSQASGSFDSQKSIQDRLCETGVLDYKIIPWTACASETGQTSDNTLTVNLALWWLHILAAGQTHIGDWEAYGALQDTSFKTNGGTDEVPSRGHMVLDAAQKIRGRNNKQRSKAKTKANGKSASERSRSERDGISKGGPGRSFGSRSAKNSFGRR